MKRQIPKSLRIVAKVKRIEAAIIKLSGSPSCAYFNGSGPAGAMSAGDLSATILAVDGEELRIGIFVKSQVCRRAEWPGTRLDAFSEM